MFDRVLIAPLELIFIYAAKKKTLHYHNMINENLEWILANSFSSHKFLKVIKTSYKMNLGVLGSRYARSKCIVGFCFSTRLFYKQLHFLFQPQVACGHMNFQAESHLAVAYSIHFQPLIT